MKALVSKAYFSRRTGSWVRWRRGSSTIVAIHALFSSIVRISGRKLRLISWAWIQLKTTEMQRSLCFFISTAIFAALLFLFFIGRGNFFDAWWSLRLGFGWKSRWFLAFIAWTSLQFGRFALEYWVSKQHAEVRKGELQIQSLCYCFR